jgi:ankyrin repeat protein
MNLKTIFKKIVNPEAVAREELSRHIENSAPPEKVRPLIEKYPVLLTKKPLPYHGFLPLHQAICHESLPLIELFLAHSPGLIHQENWSNIDTPGQLPIHMAALSAPPCLKKIIDLLVRHGADIEAKNSEGLTPLMLAGKEAAEILLRYSADIHAKGAFGRTALMVQAEYGDEDTIGLLIGAGARLEDKDNSGLTALEISLCGRVNLSAACTLLEHGAKISPDWLQRALHHEFGSHRKKILQAIEKRNLKAEQHRRQKLDDALDVFRTGLPAPLRVLKPFDFRKKGL